MEMLRREAKQADIQAGFATTNQAFLACWDLTPILF